MSETKKYTIAEVAKLRGVSERAIYKQLKSHAEELDGHIEKIQGKQWLDEYAVELLEKFAVNSAPAIVETKRELEYQELRDENERLKAELEESRKVMEKAMVSMADLIAKHNENMELIAESKLYLEQRDNATKEAEMFRDENEKLKKELESYQKTIFGFYVKREN